MTIFGKDKIQQSIKFDLQQVLLKSTLYTHLGYPLLQPDSPELELHIINYMRKHALVIHSIHSKNVVLKEELVTLKVICL